MCLGEVGVEVWSMELVGSSLAAMMVQAVCF
jgi:hypothetical protein